MITILDLALHRGAKKDEDGSINGAAIKEVGLPFMGGCQLCGACIAAYNACPSKSGHLRCANECIGDSGWETVEEANRSLFPDEINPFTKREPGENVIILGDDPESLIPEWEEAYDALPEPYKADSCLIFWVEDSTLFSRPLDDQIQALGAWVCYFQDQDEGPGYPPYGWNEWKD